ncbi:MAG TPA: hypothetical protein VF230_13235 [Acidimicrobiales bacterium]
MQQRRRAALAVLMLFSAVLTGVTFLVAPPAQATHGTQCHDGIDNDGDGLTDYGFDWGCSSYTDNSESPNSQCSDGVDNDGDGRTDYPSDYGCSYYSDDSEAPNPQCSDGADNDGDGWIDYPVDPGCTSRTDSTESPNPQCSDGVDNDGDGRTDYPSDAGCTGIADNSESCATSVVEGVVACLSTGTEVTRLSIQNVVPGSEYDVAAYVDLYRFTVAGNVVTLPCVRLVADGVDVNPCALLGGTYVSTSYALVQTFDDPIPADDPIATVGVCNAELTATVLGIGVTSAQAYTVC